MEYQKLYRSNNSKVIAGVAGGLGEFFAIDPVLIRVLFVLLAILGGGGVLIYVLLWIFVPEKNSQTFSGTAPQQENQAESQPVQPEVKNNDSETVHQKHGHRGSFIGGVILLLLGILFLIDRFIPEINFGDLWPIIFIVIGILLLTGSFSKKTDNN